MIVCPNCNGTIFVEAYASISHSWNRCTTCNKVVSARLQQGRGFRIMQDKTRQEELIECAGEICQP